MKRNDKYYYVYKITNLLNDKIYIGKRGCVCLPENDTKYMGSGILIIRAIKKYGIENFKKEIIKVFDLDEDAYLYEKELVNEEFINREDTYNIIEGGLTSPFKNMVSVYKDNNIITVSKNDPKYLSGELKHINTGKVIVFDENKTPLRISLTDERYLSGELKSHTLNKVTVKDKNGKTFKTDVNNPKYLNGELKHINCNMVNVKDINGNNIKISTNDDRYLNGELKHINKDMVTVRDKNGKCFQVSKNDPKYISGEYISSMKGYLNAKDKNGNKYFISVNDPRYLNGELFSIKTKKYDIMSKKIVQKTLDGKIIKIFEKAIEFEELNYSYLIIKKCCLGKKKKYNNFIWEYYK